VALETAAQLAILNKSVSPYNGWIGQCQGHVKPAPKVSGEARVGFVTACYRIGSSAEDYRCCSLPAALSPGWSARYAEIPILGRDHDDLSSPNVQRGGFTRDVRVSETHSGHDQGRIDLPLLERSTMGWMFPTAVSTFRRKVLIKLRKSKLTSGMIAREKSQRKPIPTVTTATKRSQWIRPGPSLL
jgi:hypothetical protein